MQEGLEMFYDSIFAEYFGSAVRFSTGWWVTGEIKEQKGDSAVSF